MAPRLTFQEIATYLFRESGKTAAASRIGTAANFWQNSTCEQVAWATSQKIWWIRIQGGKYYCGEKAKTC